MTDSNSIGSAPRHDWERAEYAYERFEQLMTFIIGVRSAESRASLPARAKLLESLRAEAVCRLAEGTHYSGESAASIRARDGLEAIYPELTWPERLEPYLWALAVAAFGDVLPWYEDAA